ncbi:FUSC family protein [Frankia sp. AiPa1]|uniref:FUSC family protein n=1 Tax=Frankia sp. AiPa1 TaxID=573492 RepID=UPI00202AF1AA|nr:FUSC family protein [Frankia sp. AiPa1]MCL9762846.1 FUSC family protein [Frankia sp. AiPa1]
MATTMGAVLATFGSAMALRALTGGADSSVSGGAVVLAVVLALTLGRVGRRGQPRHGRLLAVVVPPTVALVASEVATLSIRHRALGEVLFTVALSGAVWLRRFGPAGTRAGTLMTLPFLALIITPVPPHTHGISRLTLVVIALIATGWTLLAGLLARLLEARHTAASDAAAAPDTAPAAPAAPGAAGAAAGPAQARMVGASRPGRRRLPASTRMAVQLAVALGTAFVLGARLFPEHRTWLVLTAYIVNSGNRGRGDVALRSGQRLVGAALGTAAAGVLAGHLPVHNPWSIVAIFVLLTVGVWLRAASYAWWAACVTGVLALLYGYYGQSGTGILRERLLAVGLGAVIGLAAAWFVLPVRTGDVLRRRVADVLAALTDYLVVAQTGRRRGSPRPPGPRRGPDPADLRAALTEAHAQVESSLDRLAEIAPTLRAHRALDRTRARTLARLRGHPRSHEHGSSREHGHPGPHRYDGVEALLATRGALRAMTRALDARGAPPARAHGEQIARVRTTIVEFRRAMGRASAAARAR